MESAKAASSEFTRSSREVVRTADVANTANIAARPRCLPSLMLFSM